MSLLSSPAYLGDLEAESVFILREAAAEFARPAILYSIGKDSSVLLRLALKAFYPGRLPFSFLHSRRRSRSRFVCSSPPCCGPSSASGWSSAATVKGACLR